MIKFLTYLLLYFCAQSLCMSAAFADIYGYTDNEGVINLADSVQSSQYELVVASPVEPTQDIASSPNLSEVASMQGNHLQKLPYLEEVKGAARTSGVDGALLHAVIATESNYNPNAVSAKGAMGLMQLLPKTGRRFGAYNLYDPTENIKGGAQYLAYLLVLFNNDSTLAVAAYNAGENAVIRYGKKIPPYRETIDYVRKVMGLYKKLRTV